MPAIPNPETLIETARSANRFVEDREWKQYQRYLAKHQEQHGQTPNEPPLNFEEFCTRLRNSKTNPQKPQNNR